SIGSAKAVDVGTNNDVIGSADINAGIHAYSRIGVTGRVHERASTNGRVAASVAGKHRTLTKSGVARPGGVEPECKLANGHVGGVCPVLKERLITDGTVAASGGVVKERPVADGCVEVADGVVKKRIVADGCV